MSKDQVTEEQIATLEASLAAARGPVHLRAFLTSLPWFFLPLLVMWSAGTSLEVAARLAVGPYLCVLLTLFSLAAIPLVSGYILLAVAKE